MGDFGESRKRGPKEARRGQEEAKKRPEKARKRPEQENGRGHKRPGRGQPPGGGGGGQGRASKKPPGLGFIPLYHSVGGAREAGMHGASRLASPRLRVRVFSPLAKLGPLRAPLGGCRALSEDFRGSGFRAWGLGFRAPCSSFFWFNQFSLKDVIRYPPKRIYNGTIGSMDPNRWARRILNCVLEAVTPIYYLGTWKTWGNHNGTIGAEYNCGRTAFSGGLTQRKPLNP